MKEDEVAASGASESLINRAKSRAQPHVAVVLGVAHVYVVGPPVNRAYLRV